MTARRSVTGSVAARPQHGLALIGVLVVVVVLAALAAAMVAAQDRRLERTTAMIAQDRQLQLVLAAEALALQGLAADTRSGETIDHAGDPLFAPRSLVLDGAAVEATVTDLEGRFNLNTLYDPETGAPRPVQIDRFRRLLDVLDLDPRLAAAVVDWIDPDSRPSPGGGAEDGAYQRGRAPYRVANRPFTSTEELRLVAGMTAQAFARLEPHVAALPGFTTINVNMTTPALVQSLWPGIRRRDAEALVRRARVRPFRAPGRFVAALAALGEASPGTDQGAGLDGLGVGSSHVLLEVRIEDAAGALRSASTLSRRPHCCRVIARRLTVAR